MEKRPLSLSIIGWFLGISSIVGLYNALTMASNPLVRQVVEDAGLSLEFQQALAVVGTIIALVCAYGILKGLPWSRVLYAGWTIVSLVIGFITSPFKTIMLLSALFAAVVIFFLFRPAADRWFGAKGLQSRRADA